MKVQALRTAVLVATTPFLLLAGFAAAHAAGPSIPVEFDHCDAQTLAYDPSCDSTQPEGELTLPEGEFDPCEAQTLAYDPSCDVTSDQEVFGGDGPPAL
ncbi:hypothetical protein [Rhodococcus koreensis]